jgi:hypothetical protein
MDQIVLIFLEGGNKKIGSLSALLELSLNPFVLPLMMESYLQ